MGFLDWLFGRSVSREKLFPELDLAVWPPTAELTTPERPPRPTPPPMQPFCPHCGAEISPPPTRKRKCPHCRETILVRTRPDNRQRVIVTEAQAEEIDQAWGEKRAEDWLAKKSRAYGATEDDVARVQSELTQQFGRPPATRDVAWRLANERVSMLTQREDWGGLGNLYWQMALQLYEEGRNHTDLAKEANRFKLLGMRESSPRGGKTRVQVLTACPASKTFDDRVFTIDQALEEMPIPAADCDHHIRAIVPGRPGWCGCCWLNVDHKYQK